MTAEIRVRRGGEWTSFPGRPDESLVDSGRAVRIYLPASCCSGTCGTCRVRLVAGGVNVTDQCWALSAADREDGYILACQSAPATPVVELDYDD
ncbi:2Fe-2S iron-sulfur cluster-binding protein [Stella sp.]|uniref:2Fe-2S iron-sulfur cluster-binding protein n=1 Tax=Stella sp. TaxID=2912054 RepID=UPI0035B0E41E